MRPIFWAISAMTFLAAIFPAPVRAQDSTVYVVTYIEVVPNAVDTAATLLKSYRDASCVESGCRRFDILREISRPERFALFEIWSSVAALDNRDGTTSAVSFHEKLAKIQSAPNDERRNNGLYLGSLPNAPGLNTIYVITHVDLIPESDGKGLALLKAMRDSSSREPNNLAYEVLQQSNRPNHFTVVEMWKNMPALEAHVGVQQTRDFRQALLPMEGAPYDDRRYEILH
jgi:quinol monooxygenase YgiN